jgi:hypothetical protein
MYSSPNIFGITKTRRMKEAGCVALIGAKRNMCKFLVGNPEGMRPLGRLIRRSENNIKMEPRELAWDGMNWIDLAQDRVQWKILVNKVMNLQIP